MMAYFAGLTEEMIQKERDEVLQVSVDDINTLADPVKAALDQHYICVIGNEEKIKENADVFDKVEKLF